MMTSYSMNKEDVVLNRVFADVNEGFYVEVGANDPIEGSNSYHFYQKGWRGICIEPGTIFNKFAKARPLDISLNVAASDTCGEMIFHEFPIGHALSSLHDRQPDASPCFLAGKYERKVKVATLKEIFKSHSISEIDFMGVDVEGHERQVLLGNDWTRWRPKVLFIEATAEGRQMAGHHLWEHIVLEAGYQFVYFDGLNRFYVRQEDNHLTAQFYPPCVFDNYKSIGEVRRDEELRILRDQLRSGQTLFRLGLKPFQYGLTLAKYISRAISRRNRMTSEKEAA